MVRDKKTKIIQILNCIETGSKSGDYSNVSIFNDGPDNIEQITYGRSQTTEFGNLKKLLEMYIENEGEYAENFRPYINHIGERPSLESDLSFVNLLKEAGTDPIMIVTQDEFFGSEYWDNAKKWFDKNGFTLPLSMLVIYDSFIHSGGILWFLRKRFVAKVPKDGGDEKEWIKQYVSTRHNWLATHKSRPILRKTVYRTRMLRDQILKDNWNLEQPVNANGIIVD